MEVHFPPFPSELDTKLVHRAVSRARPIAIWTGPLQSARSVAKWWAIFGAATGAPIATDKLT
jgi:hypothetical protein